MKKLYLAILVMATVMLLGSSSTAQANLLNNPGFETPGSAWASPTSWSTGGTAPGIGQTSWGMVPHGGSWVFTVDQWGGGSAGASGLAAQPVTPVLNTGDTATLKMYISTEAGYTGSAKAKLEFLSATDVLLGTALSSSYAGTNPWTLATASGLVPAGTVKLKAYALSEQMGVGSKSAWFDDADLTVTPIPEPTSLLLLGSGLIGLFGLRKRTTK